MLTQLLRTTTVASVALFGAANVQAGPQARIVEPGHHDHGHHVRLPKFGMHTYNNGYGERVTHVRHGGIAWRLGIECGDTIVKLNHDRLRRHGDWHEALWDAMSYHNGHVDLLVRDRRSGRVVHRHIDLDPYGYDDHGPVYGGPVGPITPKTAPVVRRFDQPYPYQVGRPVAAPRPVTPRQVFRRQLGLLLRD